MGIMWAREFVGHNSHMILWIHRTGLGWWLHSQLLCHMFKLFMDFRRDNTQPPSNIVMHQRDLTETHETKPPRYMWRSNPVLWNCTLIHTTHPFSIFKESPSQPTSLDDVGFTNDTSYPSMLSFTSYRMDPPSSSPWSCYAPPKFDVLEHGLGAFVYTFIHLILLSWVEKHKRNVDVTMVPLLASG